MRYRSHHRIWQIDIVRAKLLCRDISENNAAYDVVSRAAMEATLTAANQVLADRGIVLTGDCDIVDESRREGGPLAYTFRVDVEDRRVPPPQPDPIPHKAFAKRKRPA